MTKREREVARFRRKLRAYLKKKSCEEILIETGLTFSFLFPITHGLSFPDCSPQKLQALKKLCIKWKFSATTLNHL